MSHIIPLNSASVEQNWLNELANAISDPLELLQQLKLDPNQWKKDIPARKLFSQRVPLSFVARMEQGNPNDPLLRQVMPCADEFNHTLGFSHDPLLEQDNPIPGLLHKYHNRVLMILKGGCAINCRYCFRRHFPYSDNPGNKKQWSVAIDYIKTKPQISEVILSGGDPLMAKDVELSWLFEQLEAIPHVKHLRIHSRLPVVIPSRITEPLCSLIKNSRFNVVVVTHINHPNEIDTTLEQAMEKLKKANATLLNQSVLLKGVNDNAQTLIALSERLFEVGILPYYLHLLDKVQGAGHFLVSDQQARQIMTEVVPNLSGYLVPRLMREIGGRSSKTPIDLHLE
ncbi:EF-P beta-lysylation protein EpmB [Vibrio sp. SS-MA-C1-2]|uniref:EF-P beta-lysylation protein EpmB n=1 Tax=Vibrio sp. SS-MA-C1-2 TaxID=2908646 RepID=UPI001F470B4A|nr:EF-P beta-lysylation protein EpmB [Vibrio sp. SS-MA-C1-2]UJF19519.1 EF-P beta-lysylation protein EpmB [Vibrio sp. SS-MA-C1-2]